MLISKNFTKAERLAKSYINEVKRIHRLLEAECVEEARLTLATLLVSMNAAIDIDMSQSLCSQNDKQH